MQAVAHALELSEDAVKQRLARGRALLHEQVRTMVAGTLARVGPDRAFALDVLALLPAIPAAASATLAGTAAAQGGATAKGASSAGPLAAVTGRRLGSVLLLGVAAGLVMLMRAARGARALRPARAA